MIMTGLSYELSCVATSLRVIEQVVNNKLRITLYYIC